MENISTTSKINHKPDTCPKHNTSMMKCLYENCEKPKTCKFCSLESKDGVKHLYEHYDNLKDDLFVESTSEYKNKIKDEELYGDLNVAYVEYLEKINSDLEQVFSELSEKKLIISEQISTSVISKYEIITLEFEDLVKSLNEKINYISTSDPKSKEEFREIKKQLDDKLNYLSNPSIFKKDFEEIISNFNKKIKGLKVEEILNQKFNFNLTKNNMSNLNWENGSAVISVTPRGTSYWCTKSMEMLEGPFSCKIAVRNINTNQTDSHWNYTVGLVRPIVTNETSYYNDCVLFQSNGYCALQFSGSGMGLRLFNNNNWKNGDILLIKRNDQGIIFFGINDENSYKQAFTGIMGPHRIVMGFAHGMTGDIFEMIELIKE
jgi:hypothetical protein